MKKVITYGTYDLLHYGHIRLLERAKELGDYLVVGVTADDFDKRRGKINVQQSLVERIEAVKKTGLADEIIVEEYEGQKIDDIKNYGIDVFTVGSDWIGKFDYLKEYCEVVYLDRTQGVSSTQLRTNNRTLKMGIIGNNNLVYKYINESKYVNGLDITAVYTENCEMKKSLEKENITVCDNYDDFIKKIDAVYISTNSNEHFEIINNALDNDKHVLCESPICINKKDCMLLYEKAKEKDLILMEALKTAYSTAFDRLMLLVKTGVIGKVVAIDSTCTSLQEMNETLESEFLKKQNSMNGWAPTALLPVFMLLGTEYKKIHFSTLYLNKDINFDLFTKIDLNYDSAVAQIKVGKGVKSEGQLIITGTKGYIYVPSPWWKTDYFEVRYESENDRKRYFYQLDGEGIRQELVTFVKSVENKKVNSRINSEISLAISLVIEKFNNKENLDEII